VAAEPHRIELAENPKRACPCLFVDRDGTLIEDPGYLDDPDQVRLIPDVTGVLNTFRSAGYALVIVTNQSGIGRGLYRWQDYDAVAARLASMLSSEGVTFDAVLACSHAPDDEGPCGWRKPAPGMILEAASLLSLDMPGSLMVGDKLTDIQAAQAAGLPRAVHVASGQGRTERAKLAGWRSTITVDLLEDLSRLAP